MALAFTFTLGTSVSLGLAFLLLSVVGVFLMFRLWGYPHDEETRRRAAPGGLWLSYRAIWWLYLIIYLVMMSQMVPRMWQYQVEFPARTVMHIVLGILIGLLLLLKFSIARLFRHLDMWTPVLAVLLMGCTIILSGLSMPFALQEYSLASSAVGGGVFSMENRQRVAKLLQQAEMPEDAPIADLSSVASLNAGREVLSGKCVECHDLKTILVQPRTPAGWWRTVERMGIKPTFSEPMTDQELYTATAYLIAISGDLQRSAKARKEVEDKRTAAVAEVKETNEVAGEAASGDLPPFDEAVASKTYERVCSQCHDLADVDAKPPRTSEEVKNLIIRMISENGMEAKREELDLVYLHMVKKYAGGRVVAAAAEPADPKAGEPKAVDPADPSAPTPAGNPKNPDATDPVPTPDEVTMVDPKGTEPRTPEPRAAEPRAKPKAATIDGKPLYDKLCKGCHAADGSGSAGMKKSGIPDMSDRAWQAKNSKGKIAGVLNNGVPGTKMKAFKDKLKPDEIAAVAAYVKKLK